MTLLKQAAQTDRWFNPHPDENQIIELDGFEAYRLERRTQAIRVLSGCAWITVAGKDVFVPRGEEMTVFPHRESSIISSPNYRPLVFEVNFR